jgi:hypothetical protein
MLPDPTWLISLRGPRSRIIHQQQLLCQVSCQVSDMQGLQLWQFGTLPSGPLPPNTSAQLAELVVVVLREFASWDTILLRQLAGSNILLCQHRLSGLMSKGCALRAKGFHLIYPCKQVTEAKTSSKPYMVIFNFIGYFILVLHDFPLTFLMFRFLRFYLSAIPSLPSCYFLRTQA